MDRQQILSLSESVMVGREGGRKGGREGGRAIFDWKPHLGKPTLPSLPPSLPPFQGLRNSYLLIHDKITKNQDRLKQASKPERHSSHMVC